MYIYKDTSRICTCFIDLSVRCVAVALTGRSKFCFFPDSVYIYSLFLELPGKVDLIDFITDREIFVFDFHPRTKLTISP